MGAFLFSFVLGVAVLWTAHLATAGVRWQLGHFEGMKEKGFLHSAFSAEFPFWQHFLSLILSISVLYAIYYFGDAFGSELLPHHFGYRPELGYPFFHSETARAALLGTLVAVASHAWYWDRRAAERRIQTALSKLQEVSVKGRGGRTLSIEDAAAGLRSAFDRFDPASLGLLLLLAISVAVIEAPGMLRALDTKIGKDGSVSLSVRETSRDRREGATTAAGPQQGSPTDADDENYLLKWMVGRADRDVHFICSLLAWKILATKIRESDIEKDVFKSFPTKKQCDSLLSESPSPEIVVAGALANGFKQIYQDLIEVRRYKSASDVTTGPLLSCIHHVWREPSGRFEALAFATPIVESLSRLSTALDVAGGSSFELINRRASSEMRGYLRTLADLADAEHARGLRMHWPPVKDDDGNPKLHPCAETRVFAEKLGRELSSASFLALGKDEVCSRRDELINVYSICTLVSLDSKLPYGRMALAIHANLLGEGLRAAALIEVWAARKTRAAASEAERSIVDSWSLYISRVFRDRILDSQMKSETLANAVQLASLRLNDNAAALLASYAPNFEDLASKKSVICGETSLSKLVFLLLLKYDEFHYALDRVLLRSDVNALARAFDSGDIHVLYRNTMGRRTVMPCLNEAQVYGVELQGREFVLLGMNEIEADYWVAASEHLGRKLEGRHSLSLELQGRFGHPSLASLRNAARAQYFAALKIIEGWSRLCTPNSGQTHLEICVLTYVPSDDVAANARWLMSRRDSLREYQLRLNTKYSALNPGE